MTKDDIIWGNEIEHDSNGWESFFYAEQVKKAMDIWAKQQAMAFFNYCFKTSTMFDAKLAERYDKFLENQFIEQQNKP